VLYYHNENKQVPVYVTMKATMWVLSLPTRKAAKIPAWISGLSCSNSGKTKTVKQKPIVAVLVVVVCWLEIRIVNCIFYNLLYCCHERVADFCCCDINLKYVTVKGHLSMLLCNNSGVHRRTGQFFLGGDEPSLPENFFDSAWNCCANLQNYFAQLTPPSNY